MIHSRSELVAAADGHSREGRPKRPRSRQRAEIAERVQRVLTTELGFMYNPSFDEPDADDVILAPPAEVTARSEKGRSAPKSIRETDAYLASLYEVPLLTKDEEVHLFRKMNYLKFRAHRLRQKLDPRKARKKQVEEIEGLWDEALKTREYIVRANLRLVFSIVKRYVGVAGKTFDELVSEGNVVLIRAVDRFDFARGTKFSTYATWAVVRSLFAAINQEQKHRNRFSTGLDPLVSDITDGREPLSTEHALPDLRALVGQFVDTLDEREARIITARFGLRKGSDPETLTRIGKELGVSKERVRQLVLRAMNKMRAFAVEQGIDAPDS
jgi:RNA polymerase sigma factor (sigma-70 family)